MDFDFSDEQEQLREAVRPLGPASISAVWV